MDKILIQDLIVRGRVGHTAKERSKPQKLWVDLELAVDLRRAARTDDLADTVDFMAVAKKVRQILARCEYHLAEKVADAVAAALLKEFPVRRVTVRIKKKTLPNAAFAAVEITRSK